MPDIMDFGRHSFLTWPKGLIERIEETEEEESVFSENKDWYLRMQEDQEGGWADYQ